MKDEFTFLNPGKLIDGDLELVLVRTMQADPAKGYVPQDFEMRHPGNMTSMGSIRLRIGPESNINLHYGGNIGYEVEE